MCEMSPFNPIDHIQKHGLRCVWAFVYLSVCEHTAVWWMYVCSCVAETWFCAELAQTVSAHLSSIYTAVCLTFLCSDKSTSPRPFEKEDTFCVTGAKSSWSYGNAECPTQTDTLSENTVQSVSLKLTKLFIGGICVDKLCLSLMSLKLVGVFCLCLLCRVVFVWVTLVLFWVNHMTYTRRNLANTDFIASVFLVKALHCLDFWWRWGHWLLCYQE